MGVESEWKDMRWQKQIKESCGGAELKEIERGEEEEEEGEDDEGWGWKWREQNSRGLITS